MELEIDLSNVLSRADQVEVGKEYYFFDEISPRMADACFTRGTLTAITDDEDYPFEMDDCSYSYAYAYPAPKKEMRYLTYEEMYKVWRDNPCRLWFIPSKDIWGMITDFDTLHKCFCLGGHLIYSEEKSGHLTIADIRDYKGDEVMTDEPLF